MLFRMSARLEAVTSYVPFSKAQGQTRSTVGAGAGAKTGADCPAGATVGASTAEGPARIVGQGQDTTENSQATTKQ